MRHSANHLAVAGKYLASQAFREVLCENLRFELLGPDHTETILRWRNDDAVVRGFRTTAGLTRDAHERFLANYETRDRIDFVLVDVTLEVPVGVFYLTGVSSGRPEIGKYIGEVRYRGRGIARHATRALIAFALEWLGLAELYAVTRVDTKGRS